MPRVNLKIDYKPMVLGEGGYFTPAVVTRADKEKKPKGTKLKDKVDIEKYKITVQFSIENEQKYERNKDCY